MKTSLKSLMIAAVCTIACLTIPASPACAQAFSFGYSGPGVSVGVATGYPYLGGGFYPGGYAPGPAGYVTVAPVAPVVVRPRVLVPGPVIAGPLVAGPVIGARPVVVRRGYGRYRGGPYYRAW
jgi:hypothetical protein